MKKLVPILLVVLVGVLVWRNSPGLRTRAQAAVGDYAGWTEEARRKEPVAFIEYAERQLGEDLAAYAETKTELQAARDFNQAELERAQELVAAAGTLLPAFKQAYRQAEGAAAYPIAVLGKEYSRDALIDQVEQALAEKATQESVIPSYQLVVDKAGAKLQEIDRRIADIKSKLVQLKAQKQVVQVDQLTAESDALLAKVYDLLGDNSKTIEQLGDDPVRDLSALMAAADGGEPAPKARTVAMPDVLDFLND
jgi:chromosome segregation ATPase